MPSGGDAATDADEVEARRTLVSVDDVVDELPERVFVLVLPPEGERPCEVELRRTARNETVLVAYSSIAVLVDACGSGQPWAQVLRGRVIQMCDELGLAGVILDAVVDEAPRYPEVDCREQAPAPMLEPVDEHEGYLYIPSRPVRAGQYAPRVELQPDQQGTPVMLAYTSPEELVGGCGPYQPWLAIHADDVAEAMTEAGAHRVLLNPVLAEQSRHTGPVREWDKTVIGGEHS